MSISDPWATPSPTTTTINRHAVEEESHAWIPGLVLLVAAIVGFAIMAVPVKVSGTPYTVSYNKTTTDIVCVANEDLPDPRYAEQEKVDGTCKKKLTAMSDTGALGIGFVAIFAAALVVLLAIANAVKESTRKVAAAMAGFAVAMIIMYELLKGSIDESKLDIAVRGGVAALIVLIGWYASKRLIQFWYQPKSS